MKRFFHMVEEVIFLDGDDVRRAPMAAALFKKFAQQDPILSSWNIEVCSAGSGKHTVEGSRADDMAVKAIRSMGPDISSHAAKTITAADIERASIILAIEPKHKEYVDEYVCLYAGRRVKIVPFFHYLGAPDLSFASLIGSTDLSEYVGFAKQIDSLFPRLAYRFEKETYLPVLARGHGFGTAIVKGKARVFAGIPEGLEIHKGDVVVCHTSDIPGRLPELACAIITDAHSEMSVLSEKACEWGIPCVGGTSFATQAIHDGEIVLVDPVGGIVCGADETAADS